MVSFSKLFIARTVWGDCGAARITGNVRNSNLVIDRLNLWGDLTHFAHLACDGGSDDYQNKQSLESHGLRVKSATYHFEKQTHLDS
jgi:hypothetical protein